MRALALFGLATLGCATRAQTPEGDLTGPAQYAADVLRSATRAEIAFLPSGVLKPQPRSGDLAAMLLFPIDDVAVLTLTGAQVLAALERSISLYPSPNPGFLFLSGLQVTFSKSAPPEKRVTDASVSGAALQPDRKYRVAMPGSLGRGGLGYFTVWNREDIAETLERATMESVLMGRSGTEPAPRWRPAN